MIVTGDGYVIDINEYVDEIAATIEDELRRISEGISESRGEKMIAEFHVPSMWCLLQAIESLM